MWIKLSLELHNARGIREAEKKLIVNYEPNMHFTPHGITNKCPRPWPPLGGRPRKSWVLGSGESK